MALSLYGSTRKKRSKQSAPTGKAWHVERGKNAYKNKQEDWEYKRGKKLGKR